MSFDSIAYVVLNCQEMNPVKCHHSGHGFMDCIASDIGLMNIAIHVEMDAITTDDSWLPAICKLSVGYVPHQSILSITSQ